MPPKKKPRNAFFIFTLDFKEKQAKKNVHMSMAEATTRAGKLWEQMSTAERAPWNEIAKREKLHSNDGEKYSSQGVPLSFIANEKQEKEVQERQMMKEIVTTVSNSVENGNIAEQSYFFVMVNYFVKADGVYLPAEIAVSEYSLQKAAKKTFHSYVNPVVGVFGYSYEAQRLSEETHKLPLPPDAFGVKEVGKLYNSILDFIRLENGTYPPLYTHRESISPVTSVLDFLKTDPEANDVQLKVYPIQYLLFTLKKATAEIGEVQKPESIFITDAYFDRDYYEYSRGISCEYHDQNDVGKFCAKSCVIRWGYMFSTYMFQDLALDVQPGVHVPSGTDLTSSINDDTQSFVSLQSSATHYTDPIQEPSNQYYYDEKSSMKEEDFPALGGKPRSGRNTSYETADDTVVSETDDNPWAVHRNREPMGRGRALWAQYPSGRGNLYADSPGPTKGAGRGWIFK